MKKILSAIMLTMVAIVTFAAPKLELTETLVADNYEDAAVKRAGTPELIYADIAPGLLVQTRQGVYRTSGSVSIVPETARKMPKDDQYLTSSIRVYSFGRETRRDGQLETIFKAGDRQFRIGIRHIADKPELICAVEGGQKMVIDYLSLPVDFAFTVSAKGDWTLSATSLANSLTQSIQGTNEFFVAAATDGAMSHHIALTALQAGVPTEVTVDNLMLSVSRVANKGKADYPFRAAELPEFDAQKAGWQLMFSDEFDGSDYDPEKWSVPERIRHLSFVSNGIAYVQCDYQPGTSNLVTGYIGSKKYYGYGYYEARVKFTTFNGWWAAIYLYSGAVGNPFLDGMEIDVFEDYYMRNPARKVLDHNLHAAGAGPLKSWNYTTSITRSYKDWYTIGCMWTPFEISYYLDGKLMKSEAAHSPYKSATFDAFRHATTIMPLRVLFGGKKFTVAYGKHPYDPTEKMPEALAVDWLRIYRWPGAEPGASPEVALKNSNEKYFVPKGEMMKFTVDVKRAKQSGAKIKAVHLFDSGYHLMTKYEEPYEFSFPFTDAFFSTTAWKRSGRSKEPHPFDGTLHAFAAFAEDENGGIGHSAAIITVEGSQGKPSTPYQGKAQKLPGTVVVGRYDEGGPGVAYLDSTSDNHFSNYGWRLDEGADTTEHGIGAVNTGEWMNYTVEVEKTGRYEFDFLIGSPYKMQHKVNIIIDGKLAGYITHYGHEFNDWRNTTHAKTVIDLTAGRHVIKLQFFGQFNMGDFTVQEVK